jgi:hypothetical protein
MADGGVGRGVREMRREMRREEEEAQREYRDVPLVLRFGAVPLGSLPAGLVEHWAVTIPASR